MSESGMCSVRVKHGLLFAGTWLEPGTECDLPRELAVPYSKASKQRPSLVEILGEPTGAEIVAPAATTRRKVTRRDPDDPVADNGVAPPSDAAQRAPARAAGTPVPEPSAESELAGWPGEDAFTRAGVTTVAQVRELIAQHGDAWPKQIKGIGKATAADVGEHLARLDGGSDDAESADVGEHLARLDGGSDDAESADVGEHLARLDGGSDDAESGDVAGDE